jgi:hypothetical protein
MVFNNTRGSVLMAILVHASWNTFYSAALVQLFPAPSVLGSYLNLTIAAWALALVLIAVTRGRLGYQEEDPELALQRQRTVEPPGMNLLGNLVNRGSSPPSSK